MGSPTKLTKILPAALVAAGLITPQIALAADILPEPPIIEAPEVQPIDKTGWYLRGDISYATRDGDLPMYAVPAAVNGLATFSSNDIEDGFGLGVGIGYQFTNNLRADATASYYFDSSYSGTTGVAVIGGDCAGGAANLLNDCRSTDESSYSNFQIMANVYYDLGMYNGFTPYVGAGIGGAYISYDRLENSDTCTPAGGGVCAAPYDVNNPLVTTHQGEDSWRFAWALHAGFAYDITQNAKLDFGYTYNNIEGGPMFQYPTVTAGFAQGAQGYDKGFEEHIFKAGVRYHFN